MPKTAETPRTAVVDGLTYRLVDSCVPADALALRAAFRARGIADHVNALPPRSRTRHCQLFVMMDGTVRREDSAVCGQVARAADEIAARWRRVAGLSPEEAASGAGRQRIRALSLLEEKLRELKAVRS